MDMGAFVDKEFYKKSFSLIKVAQVISPTDIILITTIFDTFPLFDLDSCFSRWTSLSFYNNWITVFLISNDAIRSVLFKHWMYQIYCCSNSSDRLVGIKKRSCTTSCRLSLRNLLTGQKCALVGCMRKKNHAHGMKKDLAN